MDQFAVELKWEIGTIYRTVHVKAKNEAEAQQAALNSWKGCSPTTDVAPQVERVDPEAWKD